MGNYLTSPNSTKFCDNGRLGSVSYAVCAMQGWRLTMEDAHVVHFFEHLPSPVDSPCAFFGVYDGHGGPQVAHFVARHIVEKLLKAFESEHGALDAAFRAAYISLDNMLTQGSQQAELEYFANPGMLPCPFKPLPTQTPPFSLPKKPQSQVRIHGQNLYRKVRSRHKNLFLSRNEKSIEAKSTKSNTENFFALVSDEIPTQPCNEKKNRRSLRKQNLPQTSTNTDITSTFPDQNPGIFHTLKSVVSSLVTRTGNSTQRTNFNTQGLATLSGCTAISVLVSKSQVVVANAGDSRAVLCRGSHAFELSKDHKPTLLEEKTRIITAGGWLEMGRINGNLNLSRALGDLIYKMNYNLTPDKQIVSSLPDVVFTDIQSDDEFLVIGCDGIWESCTSQEVINFIRMRLDTVAKLSDVLEALFEELLSPNPTLYEYGCDNMTAILVDLRPDRLKAIEGTMSSSDTNLHIEELPINT